MRFDTFGRDLGFIAILTLLALVTKWVGCGVGDRLAGASWLQSNVVGAGMVSRGEMALIVAQIGFEAKLMDAEYYSAVIVVIVLTTLIAPIILKDALRREQEPV
jgi:Kef-type K+ transport system membrane component KefB